VQAHRLRLAVAAILALGLCACGKGLGPPTASGSPAASASVANQCAHPADTVITTYPVAQMEVPKSSTWQTIPAHTIMAPWCTAMRVTSISAAAQIRFESQGICTFGEDPKAPGAATLTTREPSGALFTEGTGKTWCNVPHDPGPIRLCGLATLLLHGQNPQVISACNPNDPDLTVAVLSGSVTLIDWHGVPYTIDADQQLSYDFISRSWLPLAPAAFSAADIEIFDQQAQALGMEITKAPQTVTIVSLAPPSPTPGQTYTVTATGGGSGNPVQITIDPKSIKICSADTTSARSAIVTFLAPGNCVIDANQQGNTQYLQAPLVQQTVTVNPAPPS
jgi:hypothetical protein